MKFYQVDAFTKQVFFRQPRCRLPARCLATGRVDAENCE